MSKHIVFIHKEFPYGGAEKMTHIIANHLYGQGYNVTILTTKENRHLYPQNQRQFYDIILLPPHNIKISKNVARFIRNFIIESKVQAIVLSRELLYAKWLKSETGVKIVFQLHSSPFYEAPQPTEVVQGNGACTPFRSLRDWFLSQFYLNKYHRIYNWADAYGVLCEPYAQVIIEKLHLSASNKIYILPNALETVTHIMWNKRKTVLYVGRLSNRDKRIDRLLRIWSLAQPRMDGWHLKIVGSGPAEEYLRHYAESLSLQNITFEGQTNSVRPFYDEAAIICLTSSFEGWPMSVAEGQSNGVVPIVFDSFSGAKEMITNENEGVLVTPFNEEAYAEAMVQLSMIPERLSTMRQHVVEKAKQYSIQRMGIAWTQMLNNILT